MRGEKSELSSLHWLRGTKLLFWGLLLLTHSFVTAPNQLLRSLRHGDTVIRSGTLIVLAKIKFMFSVYAFPPKSMDPVLEHATSSEARIFCLIYIK